MQIVSISMYNYTVIRILIYMYSALYCIGTQLLLQLIKAEEIIYLYTTVTVKYCYHLTTLVNAAFFALHIKNL